MANVIGTPGNDVIDASFATPVTDGDDTISGLEGADTIFGLGGDDFISGGDGADALDGGFGTDTADYDDVTATVGVIVNLTTGLGSGGFADPDTLTNIENVSGSKFADQLIGDFNANVLKGNGGADQLVGGGGIDTLDGGDGNDILWGGSGADVMNGGAGADTLYYGNGGGVAADLPDSTGVTIALNLSGGGVGHGGFAEGDTFTGIENVVGSHFNDKIAGNAFANVLTGLGGNDLINGGGGADTLKGNGGNDTFVVINPGVTVIELAGQGADTVKSSVTCTLSANVETLVLTGALATNGTGNASANTINGNFGNNVLTGLAGNDVLKGMVGSDTLAGGLGRDVMTGGANQDLFRFDAVSDTGKNAFTRDVITDFVHGVDLIDLNAIDANGAALGNGNFTFIGSGAFTGAKGQLRTFFDGANKTVVAGDIDGNKVADFQIELTGHKVLTAGDHRLPEGGRRHRPLDHRCEVGRREPGVHLHRASGLQRREGAAPYQVRGAPYAGRGRHRRQQGRRLLDPAQRPQGADRRRFHPLRYAQAAPRSRGAASVIRPEARIELLRARFRLFDQAAQHIGGRARAAGPGHGHEILAVGIAVGNPGALALAQRLFPALRVVGLLLVGRGDLCQHLGVGDIEGGIRLLELALRADVDLVGRSGVLAIDLVLGARRERAKRDEDAGEDGEAARHVPGPFGLGACVSSLRAVKLTASAAAEIRQ